ncbi:hypothetical protein Tco_0353296 [Tanacetum coccineum]
MFTDFNTKAFDVSRFQYLIASIGMLNLEYETLIKEWEDKMERAATTASSLEAEHDSSSGPRCQDTILWGEKAQIRQGISGRVTPLIQTMMVQALEDMGEDSAAPTGSHSIPILTQPSSSHSKKKKLRRKQRKDSNPTEPVTEEATTEAHVSTPSYDPPPSGEDRMQLNELMSLFTSLQEKVLDLEKAKTTQAKEITAIKFFIISRVSSFVRRKYTHVNRE